MTAVLPLAAGGFNYTIDPDTGMKRSAANEQTIFCGGTDVVKITQDGVFDAVTGASLGFVVGVPYVWPFSAVPTGCVLLYGQACTTSYPVIRALLIASGSPYGTSGGDPLFPDYRGVTAVGKSDMGGVDRANLTGATVLGATLGAQTVTLDTTMIPSHTHQVTGSTSIESANHTHAVSGTTAVESASHTHGVTGTTGTMSANASHDHSAAKAANTSTFVKSGVDQGGIWGGGDTTATTSSTSTQHTHDISITSGVESAQHNHTLNITSGGVSANHSHTVNLTSASTGGGAAHANVQPSIVQNYIMRVA